MRTLIFIVVAVLLSGSALAGTETKDNYTLTVSKGSPAYLPSPAKVDENVIVNFTIDITSKKGESRDEIVKKITERTYLLTVGGESIKIVQHGFQGTAIFSTDKLSVRKEMRGAGLAKKVSPKLITTALGEKTVTLKIDVKLKEENPERIIELSASETMTFGIADMFFAVYIRDGEHTDRSRYDIELKFYKNGKPKAGYHVINLGHAAWDIDVSGKEFGNLSSDQREVANQPWGFIAANDMLFHAEMLKAANELKGEMKKGENSFLVTVPGLLTNTQDKKLHEVKRFVLPPDKAKSALNRIISVKNKPQNYTIPGYNCADACLDALKAADLPAPDCGLECTLKYTTNEKVPKFKQWHMKISDPRKLQEELKKL